ncbi:MAG: hypothetical protein WB762_28690 [Candidatus Sulfotelmatobacter sp.]
MAELKANGARRSTASERRALRRKARTLHVHSKHASSVQTVQNRAETVRKAPRAAAEMTLKQQALAEIKAAWQRIEKYNLEFGKICCEWTKVSRPTLRASSLDGVCENCERNIGT